MAKSLSTTTKFHAFNRQDTTYNSFDDLKIGISVFVPKNVAKALCLPVLVRWHGGALINGGRAYEPWFPRWTIELAAHHNAILVCPDYRLLPESSGLDIISDLHHFYTWLHTHLADFLCQHFPLQPPVPDLGRILITGESAGGYMAVQSVLLGEVKGVKAVIAHYPMLDMQNHWYSKPGRKEICGQLPPDYPAGWLDRQLNLAKESKPVTHRIPKEGELDTFVALLQEGRYTQVLGSDATLFPIQNLERMKSEGGKLLPMWIFHGDQDTIIPIDGMWAFKQRAVDVFGQEESGTIVTTVAKGQEHGFDNDEISLETNWVVEGRKWLSSHWP